MDSEDVGPANTGANLVQETQNKVVSDIASKPKLRFWKIIVLMLLITVAIVGFASWRYLSGPPTINIQGYYFLELDNGDFRTEVTVNGGRVPIDFRLDPRNAAAIPINPNVTKMLLSSSRIYISIDPLASDRGKLAIAAAQLARIPGAYHIETKGAYVRDISDNSGIPVMTCDDVSRDRAVVSFEVGESAAIDMDEKGCIILRARDGDELILVADRLGMALLGVI